MRYLVIASCEDARTGKEFEVGEEFLPEPDIDQAARLKNAGCLREIPDDAPALPGNDDSAAVIADLRNKLGENASKAEGEYNALNARLTDLSGKHDALVEENKTARGLLDAASGENDKLRRERDALASDKDDLLEAASADYDKLRGERDALASDKADLLESKQTLTARVTELEGLLEAATKPVDTANNQSSQDAPAPTAKKRT